MKIYQVDITPEVGDDGSSRVRLEQDEEYVVLTVDQLPLVIQELQRLVEEAKK